MTAPLKTLADVRRRTVTGTRLEVTGQTRRPELVGQVRTVIRTRATGYDFAIDGDDRELPVYWPAARAVRITGPDTYEYDLPSGGTVRLRFMDAG